MDQTGSKAGSGPFASNRRQTGAVLFLLALHAVLAVHSTLTRSATVDEIFHVTGGYLFNREGDFRIHPENGVLPQRLHALPALLLGASPPPFQENPAWQAASMFGVSHQFFYEVGNDPRPMLLGARIVNLGFSLGLCLLVFFWARALGGAIAGLTALGLAACSPTLLAHGPLATSDMAAALLLPASAGAFWWQLRRPDWRRTALSAGIFGLACVAKFSAVLLLPVFGLLLLLHFGTRPAGAWPVRRVALAVLVHGAAAVGVIWLTYGGRFALTAPHLPPMAAPEQVWRLVLQPIGWQAPVLRALLSWHVLPEAFVYGYAHTYMSSLARSAFLAGDYSTTGWISFFPLAFLWKSAPAELLGTAALLAAAILRRSLLWATLLRLAPLAALVVVYGLAAVTSSLNIGHRHILVLYPALFIGTGIVAAKLWPHRAAPASAALLLLQSAAAASVHPYHLAYFNPLAGGPENGWRLLVDSSLDWGQDLPGLKRWLDGHADGEPVHLAYFGSGDPLREGIHATLLPSLPEAGPARPWHQLQPGIYALSATLLQQAYSPVRGPWTLNLETEYQTLRSGEAFLIALQDDPVQRRAMLTDGTAETWRTVWRRYEILRFARLCHWLRVRPPETIVGGSILVHRVSAADLKAAVGGSLADWQQLIERTVAAKAR